MIVYDLTQNQIIAALRERAEAARQQWRKAIGVSQHVTTLLLIAQAWDEAEEIARGMGARHPQAHA